MKALLPLLLLLAAACLVHADSRKVSGRGGSLQPERNAKGQLPTLLSADSLPASKPAVDFTQTRFVEEKKPTNHRLLPTLMMAGSFFMDDALRFSESKTSAKADAAAALQGHVDDVEQLVADVMNRLLNHSTTSADAEQKSIDQCMIEVKPFRDMLDSVTIEMAKLQTEIEEHKRIVQELPAQIDAAQKRVEALNITISIVVAKNTSAVEQRKKDVETFNTNAMRAKELLSSLERLILRIDTAPGLANRGDPSLRTNFTALYQQTTPPANGTLAPATYVPQDASVRNNVSSLLEEIQDLYSRQMEKIRNDPEIGDRSQTLMELGARSMATVTQQIISSGISDNALNQLRWALKYMVAQIKDYMAQLLKDEAMAAELHKEMLQSLAGELQPAQASFKEALASLKSLQNTLAAAQLMLPDAQASYAKKLTVSQNLKVVLAPKEAECAHRRALFATQRQHIKEQLDTLKAISHVVDVHRGRVPMEAAPTPSNVTEPANPCASDPCKDGVCVPVAVNCTNKFPTELECPKFRCDPFPPSAPNACLVGRPCPSNTQCVAVQVAQCDSEPCPKPYKCIPNLSSFEAQKPAKNISTCFDHKLAREDAGLIAESGIYILTDPEDGLQFPAYCDMDTQGGGWMLAFKQSKFSSGSVQHDDNWRGAASLLTTEFESFSTSSIMAYRKPSEILFRSSVPNNWFVTGALDTWQFWSVSPSSRYCLYRPQVGDNGFKLSPLWNLEKTDMWPDADIELMQQPYPSISAITIGRFNAMQKAPQCGLAHCSPYRHGRYNGNCQNGSAGEGNWLIFVR